MTPRWVPSISCSASSARRAESPLSSCGTWASIWVELRDEVLEAREVHEQLLVGASVAADAIRSEDARRVGAGRAGPDANVDASVPEIDVPSDGSVSVLGLAHPLCPGCGQRLNDVLATATVAPEPAAGSARRRGFGPVTLIYCGACGHTLAATR